MAFQVNHDRHYVTNTSGVYTYNLIVATVNSTDVSGNVRNFAYGNGRQARIFCVHSVSTKNQNKRFNLSRCAYTYYSSYIVKRMPISLVVDVLR